MQLNSLALLGLTALHATSSVGSPLAGGGAAQQLVLGHGNTPYVSSVNCSYCPDVGFDLGISYAYVTLPIYPPMGTYFPSSLGSLSLSIHAGPP